MMDRLLVAVRTCCFLLLLFSGALASLVVTTYSSSQAQGELRHMIVNPQTGHLYVGGVNSIMVLSGDLQPITVIRTGPKNDSLDCPARPGEDCEHPRSPMDSYSQALALDTNRNTLIACSTLYYGYCFKISLADYQVREVFLPVVPNDRDLSSVVFMSAGINPEGVLYVGATRSSVGSSTYRNRVPMLAVRNLETFELASMGITLSSAIYVEASLREDFKVYFQDGFSHNGYNYFLTVQRESIGDSRYQSRLIRVCQQDPKLRSYIEVPITCSDGNYNYNLIRKVFLSRPGSLLASSLDLPEDQEALFAVFAKSTENSKSPQEQSALCVYSMESIDRHLLEAVRKCFSGIGSLGPEHIQQAVACTRSDMEIDEMYCGEKDINNLLEVKQVVSQKGFLGFPGYLVNSLGIKVVHEHTVAFLATNTGHLLKARFQGNKEGTLYSDMSIDVGNMVKRDTMFDSSFDHFYAMTGKTVHKIELSDCGKFFTCSDCLGANDPHCGWCSVSNKCSQKRECEKTEDWTWLAFTVQCPSIISVDPELVPYANATDVEFVVKVKYVPSNALVMCLLEADGYKQSAPVSDLSSGEQIQCDTFTELPSFPKGQDHIVLRLSLQATGVTLGSTNVTFYDCKSVDSCMDCTKSSYPCMWCGVDAQCSYMTEQCSDDTQQPDINDHSSIHFNGDGFVVLDKKGFQPNQTSLVEMKFRTYADDGLLYMIGQTDIVGDYMAVELRSGKVVYQYDLGSGGLVLASKLQYNDGAWHTVTTSRNKRHGLLKVDGVTVAAGHSPGMLADLTISNNIYIGAYRGANYSSVTRRGLRGCIKELRLGSALRDFTDNTHAENLNTGCPTNANGLPKEIRSHQVINQGQLCPTVEMVNETLSLSAGEPHDVYIRGLNLKHYHHDIKCRFDTGSGVIIDATKQDFDNDGQPDITCKSVVLPYPEDAETSVVDVAFSIIWGTGNKGLDNTTAMSVQLYECSALADNCGKCVVQGQQYKCGWCESHCSLKSDCRTNWLSGNDTCPNPVINSIIPNSGPVNGGTRIVVKGQNLAAMVEQLVDGVTVAGVPCIVNNEEFSPTERFVCITKPAKRSTSGPMKVTVNKMHTTESNVNFTYVDMILSDVQPWIGPVSGGTRVTLTGRYLDTGSHLYISIRNESCLIKKRNSSHIIFVTPKQRRPKPHDRMLLSVDSSELMLLPRTFRYVRDPVVVSIEPRVTILSGGNLLEITGMNLHCVEKPLFVVYAGEKRRRSDCNATSQVDMQCPLPALTRLRLSPTMETPAEIEYGLIMDGVQNLRNLSQNDPDLGPISVYPDPIIHDLTTSRKTIKYRKNLHLVLEGENLMVLSIIGGAEVLISGDQCEILNITETYIRCTPPAEPENLDPFGNAEIKVTLGNYLATPGYIKYHDPDSDKLPLVFGIIGGVALPLIILLICLILYIKRRQRRRKKKAQVRKPSAQGNTRAEAVPLKEMPHTDYDTEPEPENEEKHEAFNLATLKERIRSRRVKESIEEVLIPRERLKMGDMLGRGHFGCVFAAELVDEDFNNPEKVAVKTLQGGTMEMHVVENFLKEGISMMHFNHPHVLKLLGICFDDKSQPMVILPYMASGDLRSYVKDKTKNFTLRQLLKLAQQVAEGMAYLASLNFVHRDLAARNCMIDDKSRVKVADFGLSKNMYDKEYYSTNERRGKMPIKWMALESLEDFVFTTKSDVWSFGILMWELMTRGGTPYPDVDVFDIRNYLESGRRLRQPKYCPEHVYRIMKDCWYPDPEVRPSFIDLVNTIELLLSPPRRRQPSEPSEPLYMNLKETADYLKPIEHKEDNPPA